MDPATRLAALSSTVEEDVVVKWLIPILVRAGHDIARHVNYQASLQGSGDSPDLAVNFSDEMLVQKVITGDERCGLFIEAKAVSKRINSLDRTSSESLSRYARAFLVGAVTNGPQWRFVTAARDGRIIDVERIDLVTPTGEWERNAFDRLLSLLRRETITQTLLEFRVKSRASAMQEQPVDLDGPRRELTEISKRLMSTAYGTRKEYLLAVTRSAAEDLRSHESAIAVLALIESIEKNIPEAVLKTPSAGQTFVLFPWITLGATSADWKQNGLVLNIKANGSFTLPKRDLPYNVASVDSWREYLQRASGGAVKGLRIECRADTERILGALQWFNDVTRKTRVV